MYARLGTDLVFSAPFAVSTVLTYTYSGMYTLDVDYISMGHTGDTAWKVYVYR